MELSEQKPVGLTGRYINALFELCSEKKIIDDLDKESGFRSYDEYITSDKGNHFICPRFWCLSDKKAPNGRSLSFQCAGLSILFNLSKLG